jgi:hypothetical protein
MHFYGANFKQTKKKRCGTAPWLTENHPYPHIFCRASVRKMAQAEICDKCAVHLEICTNLGIENKSILRFN